MGLCSRCVGGEQTIINTHHRDREHKGCTARLGAATESWLQRSQMFIEPLLTTTPRSSGAQCSGMSGEVEHVSLLWSDEESFGGRAFYKYFVPTGRGAVRRKTLSRKQEVAG